MSWAEKIRGGSTSSATNASILGDAPSLPGTNLQPQANKNNKTNHNNNNNNKTSAWGPVVSSKTQSQNEKQQKEQAEPTPNNNLSVPAPKSSGNAAAATSTTTTATTSPSPSATASAGSMTNPCPTGIEFYVVLDFEATCSREVRLKNQEIIEFPSVIVDAQRAAVVSEFQRFVKPIHNPKLTDFCTDLTGIPQLVVDEAKTFAPVYAEYHEWLAKCGLMDPSVLPRVAWVTCGDWDLKTMLPQQLRNARPESDAEDRKHRLPQQSPPHFQRWINLKVVFQSAFHKHKIGSMQDMATAANVQLRGHHHSGIDDCRNIAQCLIALLRRQTPVSFTFGSFSPEEVALQKSPFLKKNVSEMPSDLAPLSKAANAALEKAQADSKIQQQLEEAGRKGNGDAAARVGSSPTNNNNNKNNNGNVQQQGGNRRNRENTGNDNAAAGATNNNNNQQNQRANNNNNNNNKGNTGAAATGGLSLQLSPMVEVDTIRNAIQDLLQPLGKGTDANAIQAIVFPKGPSDMTRISKGLSNALRHNALEWGIPMSLNGFVKVSDLLRNNRFHQATPTQLAASCFLSDKQRFSIFYGATKETCNNLYIRANQGHSIEDLMVDMEIITNPKTVPIAVHGTRMDAWNAIRTQGLSRMQRQHIHFASGLPGQDGVISGMRGSCDVLIYLNVAKVLQDGIPLFRSSNGVILSPGKDGIISPAYFEKVVDRRSGRTLN